MGYSINILNMSSNQKYGSGKKCLIMLPNDIVNTVHLGPNHFYPVSYN